MRAEILKAIAPKKGQLIRAQSFQAVTFYDEAAKQQIIVLYALGEDGIVREYAANKWNEYPIKRE